MGGLRHLTGEPGRVTVRVGVSVGDTLSALHGTIGVLAALRERDCTGGRGQVVDVALYEAVFNCMESLLPEYSAFGTVRGAPGSSPARCAHRHRAWASTLTRCCWRAGFTRRECDALRVRGIIE